MSEKKTRGAGRTRNFACVVYKDSAPENWQSIIADLKIPIFISPYHDRDVTSSGEPKKPHWHVQFYFDSVKTKEQVIQIIETFGGVGCEVVNSARGYARYLCHLDDPNKAQYKPADVQAFGGLNYLEAIGTSADKAKSIREMFAFIEENDVRYFSDFLLQCSVDFSEWFDCLINSGAYIIKEYIKSRSYKLDRESRADNGLKWDMQSKEMQQLRDRYEKLQEEFSKKNQ